MSIEKLYELTYYIFQSFHPLWYEAKEEINEDGKTVWFHGFHTIIDEEIWNLDLWFFDLETINKAEAYCENIMKMVKQTPEIQEHIIIIKQELQKRGLYGFDQYSSMDVYRAVLEQEIADTDELLSRYIRMENKL